MAKAKGTYYGPVGRCIYCPNDPISDEHVVPDGLGGNKILKAASCKTCQDEINHSIENPCMQFMFRDIRYRRNLGTRRKRPTELPQHEYVGTEVNIAPPAISPESTW